MCTWVNVRNGDHFDWTIRSGSTPSSQTGPTSDHNGDATGMTNTHIQLHRYVNLAVARYFEKCYICVFMITLLENARGRGRFG